VSDPTPPSVDGRTAIRDRNREAVIDAVLALFVEGVISPSPEAAARRAGLSVRSVYRYFADRDDLVRAAIARRLEMVDPVFEQATLVDGPLAARIERLVAGRLTLYEATQATQRAIRTRAALDPLVEEHVALGIQAMREQVAGQFAPELEALDPERRRLRLDACDALLQLTTIDLLIERVGRTPEEVAAVLTEALASVLGAGPDPT
jgi:AcrR family transcriptional regulator